ncbi:MAG: transglutaminase domain-containing protein [Fimbriimonas sp.]|nr:transglutaminase domain-containing protein [Fimbriimonas sp.]
MDYVLMGVCSCLAAYSGGMSVQSHQIGYFSVSLVVVGTIVSYFIRLRTLNTSVIKWDGYIYSGVVVASIYFGRDLGSLMPEGGFPREIAAAGWLSWMLILGSFATWQDSTLLFQAIPCLAIFGLVGCYDTYSGVTFNFFVFLICLATLFARAHGRQMLRQAAQSGYFTRGLAPGTPIPSVETTPGLAMDLKKGPWRWVAGPEWALVSALAVVLLSLIGAPLIRNSVSGVAGMVTLPPPPLKTPSFSPSQSIQNVEASVSIGRGPNHLLPRPVLEARLDKLRYLREQTFLSYTGHGWQNTPTHTGQADIQTPTDIATVEMLKYNSYRFDVTVLQPLRYLPLPAEVNNVQVDRGGVASRYDGTIQISFVTPYETHVSGQSFEAAPDVLPKDAVKDVQSTGLLDVANIPADVTQLALTVTKDCKSDYEKVQRLEDEIAKRIVYNQDVEQTPSGKDPVAYALFEKHQAYCDIYASAMVLMARAVGIPARYVQGYLPDNRRLETNGMYLVSDQDYHAWAELMFKGVGWVVSDPSTKASAVKGKGIGDGSSSSPWYSQGPVASVLNAMIVVVLAAGVFLAFRALKINRRSANPRAELEATYVRFCKCLERRGGHRRHVSQTADEFLAAVRPRLGAFVVDAEKLNDRFVLMLYGSTVPTSHSVAGLKKDVGTFIKALSKEPIPGKEMQS